MSGDSNEDVVEQLKLRESLLALTDRYHDAEEKSDDLTCMESYDTAMKMGFTEEEWKDAYSQCWQVRMALRRKS